MKNKRIFKCVLAIVLATGMTLASTACSKSESTTTESAISDNTKISGAVENVDKTTQRFVAEYGNLKLAKPANSINAEDVFKNLEYTKEMLAGNYCFEDVLTDGYVKSQTDGVTEFVKSHKITKINDYDAISLIPVHYEAGESSYSDEITLTFITEDSYTLSLYGDYEIDGSKLIFTPNSKYDLPMDTIEYEFTFKGGILTLSYDGESIDLIADDFREDEYNSVNMTCTASGQNKIDNVEGFEIYKRGTESGYSYIQLDDSDEKVKNAVGYFSEDGLFNFSWSDKDGTEHAYEYVYFYCDKDGLILTDGTTVYNYK